MITVYKYTIPFPCDRFTLMLPHDAVPLDVQIQHGQMVMWALVNTDSLPTGRVFALAGTGNPICYDMKRMRHISSVQMHGGTLVWHIFEIT